MVEREGVFLAIKEFFLLSNACVLSLMGREEEKLWSVLSEGQLLMGQTK